MKFLLCILLTILHLYHHEGKTTREQRKTSPDWLTRGIRTKYQKRDLVDRNAAKRQSVPTYARDEDNADVDGRLPSNYPNAPRDIHETVGDDFVQERRNAKKMENGSSYRNIVQHKDTTKREFRNSFSLNETYNSKKTMVHNMKFKRQTSSQSNADNKSPKPIEINENKVRYLDEDTAKRLGIIKGDDKGQYFDESSDMLSDPSLKNIVKHIHILDEKPGHIPSEQRLINEGPLGTTSNGQYKDTTPVNEHTSNKDSATSELPSVVSESHPKKNPDEDNTFYNTLLKHAGPFIDINENHVKQLENDLNEIDMKHTNSLPQSYVKLNMPQHSVLPGKHYHGDILAMADIDGSQIELPSEKKDIPHRQYGKSLTRTKDISQKSGEIYETAVGYLTRPGSAGNVKESFNNPHDDDSKFNNMLIEGGSEKNEPDSEHNGMRIATNRKDLNKDELDEDYVRLPITKAKELMEKYMKATDTADILDTRNDLSKALSSASITENDLKKVQKGPNLSTEDYRKLVAPNDLVLDVLKTNAEFRNDRYKDLEIDDSSSAKKAIPKESNTQKDTLQNEDSRDSSIEANPLQHLSDDSRKERKFSFQLNPNAPNKGFEKSNAISQYENNMQPSNDNEREKEFNEKGNNLMAQSTKHERGDSRSIQVDSTSQEKNDRIQSVEKPTEKINSKGKPDDGTHPTDDSFSGMLREKGVWHPDNLEFMGNTAELSRRKLVDTNKYITERRGRWHPGVDNIEITDQVDESPRHLPRQIAEEIAGQFHTHDEKTRHLPHQKVHKEKLHNAIGSYNFDGLQDIKPGSSFQIPGKGGSMIGDVYSRNKLAGELDHVINEDWDLRRDDPTLQDGADHIGLTLDNNRNITKIIDLPKFKESTNSSSTSFLNSSFSSTDGTLFDMFLSDDTDKTNPKTLNHSFIPNHDGNVTDDVNLLNDMYLIFNHSTNNISSYKSPIENRSLESNLINHTIVSSNSTFNTQNSSAESEKDVVAKAADASGNALSSTNNATHGQNHTIKTNSENTSVSNDNATTFNISSNNRSRILDISNSSIKSVIADNSMNINVTNNNVKKFNETTMNGTLCCPNNTATNFSNSYINNTSNMEKSSLKKDNKTTTDIESRKEMSASNISETGKSVNVSLESNDTTKVSGSVMLNSNETQAVAVQSNHTTSGNSTVDISQNALFNRNDSFALPTHSNKNESTERNITGENGNVTNSVNVADSLPNEVNPKLMDEIKNPNEALEQSSVSQEMKTGESLSSPSFLSTAAIARASRISDLMDEQTTSKLLHFLAPLRNIKLVDDSPKTKSLIDNNQNSFLPMIDDLRMKNNIESHRINNIGGKAIDIKNVPMNNDVNPFIAAQNGYNRPAGQYPIPLFENKYQGGIAFPISLAKYIDLEPILNADGSIRYVGHRMRENIIMPDINLLKQKMAEGVHEKNVHDNFDVYTKDGDTKTPLIQKNLTPINISKPFNLATLLAANSTGANNQTMSDEKITKASSSVDSSNLTKTSDSTIGSQNTSASNKTLINTSEAAPKNSGKRTIQNVDSVQALLNILDFNQALSVRIKNLKRNSQPFKPETTSLIKNMLNSMNSFYSILNKTINSTVQSNRLMRNNVEEKAANESIIGGNSLQKDGGNATAANTTIRSTTALMNNGTNFQSTTTRRHNVTSNNTTLLDLEQYNYNILQDISRSVKDNALNEVIINSLKRRYSSPFSLSTLPVTAFSALESKNEGNRRRPVLENRYENLRFIANSFGHPHVITPFTEGNRIIQKLPLQMIASKRDEFLSPIDLQEIGRKNGDFNATITHFQYPMNVSHKSGLLDEDHALSGSAQNDTFRYIQNRTSNTERADTAKIVFPQTDSLANSSTNANSVVRNTSANLSSQKILVKSNSVANTTNVKKSDFTNVSKPVVLNNEKTIEIQNAIPLTSTTLASIVNLLQSGRKNNTYNATIMPFLHSNNDIDKNVSHRELAENETLRNASNRLYNREIVNMTHITVPKTEGLGNSSSTDRKSQVDIALAKAATENTTKNNSFFHGENSTKLSDFSNTSKEITFHSDGIKDNITSSDARFPKNITFERMKNGNFLDGTSMRDNNATAQKTSKNSNFTDEIRLRDELLLAIKHVKENAFQLLSKNIV